MKSQSSSLSDSVSGSEDNRLDDWLTRDLHCEFCLKQTGYPREDWDFAVLGRSRASLTVAAVGPVSRYHLLVVPSLHLLSIAELTEEDRCELMVDVRFAYHFVEWASGIQPVIFENGGGGRCPRGGCVQHAHVNVAGTNATRPPSLSSRIGDDLEGCRLDRLRGTNYNLWADSTGVWVATGLGLPARTLRRHILAHEGFREYEDYAIYPRVDLIRDCVARYETFHRLARKGGCGGVALPLPRKLTR